MARYAGHSRAWTALPALVLLAVVGPGCGKQSLDTPEACLKAFDAAMRGGKTETAAKLLATEKWAEDNNGDWGTAATSQRGLILSKMRDDKAGQLESLRSAYTQANYQIGAPQINGEWATVQLTGAGNPVTVQLYQRNGEWRIYSFGSLAAGE